MEKYEYGIAYRRDSKRPTSASGPNPEDLVPHREGLTKEEADEWLAEWLKDGGRPDVFYVIRRPIGEWEKA